MVNEGDLIELGEAMRILDADHGWRLRQLEYEPARIGHYAIENFSIDRNSPARLRTVRDEGMLRDPGYGDFTRLVEIHEENGKVKRDVWMSDTRAEILEHQPLFNAIHRMEESGEKGDVLINGLGLGMAVQAALGSRAVGHVDVVEKDPTILALIRRYLPSDRCTVRVADAYYADWPKGKSWALAWHDIWPSIDDDNIDGMDNLERKYAKRVGWQGCWQREGCEEMASVMRRMRAGTLPVEEAERYLRGDWKGVFGG